MEQIEIIPLVGIKLNDKNIALSVSREEIKSLLGEPCVEREDTLFYFDNELRFDFDKSGKVEFIEFLAGIDGKIQPQIYGVYAFKIKADDLYNILREKNSGDIEECEKGYSYRFLNIGVGIFRTSIPESVQEMIEEAANDGVLMDAEEIEYEMRRANHWATIGIGTKNYGR